MTDDWIITSRFLVEEPDKLRMTLKTTARMQDWEKLRDQLDQPGQSDIAYHFVRQINSMLSQARKTYWPEEPTP